MSEICAWCGNIISSSQIDENVPLSDPSSSCSHGDSNNCNCNNSQEDRIVHSVCKACQLTLNMQDSVYLQEFIDNLDVPIAVISSGGVVETGNNLLASLLDQPLSAIQKQLGGVVFECVNASLPQGCGKTVHCSGCTVRRTVEDTFRTGAPHYKVPAYLKCASKGGKPRDIELLISTEKIQDMVFLRIDSM